MSDHMRLMIAAMMRAASSSACAGTAPNKEIVLYSFQGGSDGAAPSAGLIYENGFLFGTTATGGSGCGTTGCGTVFEVDPNTGAETVIYRFAGGKDGQNPVAGLIYENGLLYGTTQDGGPAEAGTVFSVNPATSEEQVLYSFKGGKDGASPEAGLVYDNGLLFGTTAKGGPLHYGTVFEVDLSSDTETIIHAFNQESGGGTPPAGVILHDDSSYTTPRDATTLSGRLADFL
jgi:uncharacterized repeat protein (TIGR03803 family)